MESVAQSGAEGIILETKGLTKTFGGLTAVDHLNFALNKGEIRAVIGPNGAGKTTFFNLLVGTLTTTEGRVFFKGEDITNLAPYKISQRGIGRTLQITSIFGGLTVFENIWAAVQSRKMFFNPFIHFSRLRDVEAKTRGLVELIGLTDKSDTPASDLSYGDQRLLEIGLALGTAPQLLLLDEPTAGLSAEETAIVTEKVKELSATQTIILVEHDMEVVMGLADTITVLHYGQKIAEGTPDEIRRNEEVIRVYLGGD